VNITADSLVNVTKFNNHKVLHLQPIIELKHQFVAYSEHLLITTRLPRPIHSRCYTTLRNLCDTPHLDLGSNPREEKKNTAQNVRLQSGWTIVKIDANNEANLQSDCNYVSSYAHAIATFTGIAREFGLCILRLKQPEPTISLDGCSLLHVMELFLPVGLWVTRAWIAEY
jgi:hypothetical protein